MDALRRRELAFYLGMALVAEPGARRGKELFHRGPVRIMAGGAAARQRRMHDLLLDIRLHVDMAGEAEISAVFKEQTRILRLMRIMTGGAVPCGCGAVDELEVRLIRMACQTEVFGRLDKELWFR